ncbi:Dabb family protein [Cryobacterium psychrophilum]|uniref:Dabb family protein n=1 Tax=Cryobacterium psychrophilum TaxID=41988 RepID=A0A4Y8KNU3_9MICO|nr:Dabb family protein [Cryobacterium psychrophilum]TDW30384.1 stress responsive alpha/beta barrel protein [Cryobacterium psychrophilum]TFD79075.1 Dabb family protein [Cryobacterium psychrophilum]
MTIRHIVCWQLAPTDPVLKAEAAARVSTGLGALVGVVPEIRELTVGADVVGGANWDLALIADFDDFDSLARYQAHPEHVKIGEYIRTVVSARIAVDLEL